MQKIEITVILIIQTMNTFCKFIIQYRPWIPCENNNSIQYLSNEDFCFSADTLDIRFFKNDAAMISYISDIYARSIYQKYESSLKDLNPILPDIDFIYCAFVKEDITRFCYFEHIDLINIGITKFAIKSISLEDEGFIYDENDIIIIDLLNLPNYEREVIENYIWNMCIDAVVNKLRKMTTFNIEKRHIDGTSCYVLKSNGRISQINTIYQLQMYIERHHYYDLFLIGKLLKSNITIPRKLINLPIEELPRFVDINVMLWKINGNPEYVRAKDFYQLEKVRFQIIINSDMSISLVRYPKDIELIINKQIQILDEHKAFTHYKNYLVVAEKFIALFEYLHKNHIQSCIGEIDRILEDSETNLLKRQLEVFYKENNISLLSWNGAKFIRLKN